MVSCCPFLFDPSTCIHADPRFFPCSGPSLAAASATSPLFSPLLTHSPVLSLSARRQKIPPQALSAPLPASYPLSSLPSFVSSLLSLHPSSFYLLTSHGPVRSDCRSLTVSHLSSSAPSPTVHVVARARGGCPFFISAAILCAIFVTGILSVCTCGGTLLLWPLLIPWLFILPCFCL